MRARILVVACSFLFVAGLATAQTPPERSATVLSGPSPQQVLDSPRAHIGGSVQWVVTYSCVLIEVDKDGRVSASQIAYDWRDISGSASVLIVGPSLEQTRWVGEDAGLKPILKSEPRLLAGRIKSIDATTGPDGKAHLSISVDDVSIAPVPISPKTRISGSYVGALALKQAGQTQTPKTQTEEGAYAPGNGVSWPSVVKETKPIYPDGADQKLQGSVELELVVGDDGKVASAKVTKSLDQGGAFDKAALAAAKAWEFKPGVRDGKPVATKVSLILEFRKK